MSTIVAVPPEAQGQAESTLAGRVDVTPEELLAMPDGEHYELVERRPRGANHEPAFSPMEAKVIRRLDGHCEKTELGWVLGPTCGYRCFSWKPGKVRRPDASFIARDRLPPRSSGRKVTSPSPRISPWRSRRQPTRSTTSKRR